MQASHLGISSKTQLVEQEKLLTKVQLTSCVHIDKLRNLNSKIWGMEIYNRDKGRSTSVYNYKTQFSTVYNSIRSIKKEIGIEEEEQPIGTWNLLTDSL